MLSTKAAEVTRTVGQYVAYLHEDRHTVDFENMQCILRFTQRCLARRRDFGQLPAALRLALIWGHSLAVQNRIQRRGALPEEFTEFLTAHTDRLPWSLSDEEMELDADVAYPPLVWRPHLTYHALGRVLNRHPAHLWENIPVRTAITAALQDFINGTGKDSTLLFLARDPKFQANAMDSLFGGHRELALEPLLGEKRTWFTSERRKADVVALLMELELCPDDAEPWLILFDVLVNALVDTDLKPRCAAIASSVNLMRLYNSAPELPSAVAQILFTWMEEADCGAERLLGLVREWQQTTLFSTLPSKEAREFAAWVTECAYWVARREPTAHRFDHCFTGLMERLLRESRSMAQALAPVIASLACQNSSVDYPGLQRLVLVVRAGS